MNSISLRVTEARFRVRADQRSRRLAVLPAVIDTNSRIPKICERRGLPVHQSRSVNKSIDLSLKYRSVDFTRIIVPRFQEIEREMRSVAERLSGTTLVASKVTSMPPNHGTAPSLRTNFSTPRVGSVQLHFHLP